MRFCSEPPKVGLTLRVHYIHTAFLYYANAISNTIIRAKPKAKPIVAILECAPEFDSGIFLFVLISLRIVFLATSKEVDGKNLQEWTYKRGNIGYKISETQTIADLVGTINLVNR